MKDSRHPGRLKIKNTHGFTLIEVMIVMVIIAILATGVVFMFANPSAKSKNQAFTLLGELNMARSEAVTRNEDVLVTFLPGAALADLDGYRIWIDDWHDTTSVIGSPPQDGIYTEDTEEVPGPQVKNGDTLIRETIFREVVQYYDPTSLPAGGPATTPGVGSTANNLIGSSGILLDDGNVITNFSMESDGTLEDGITKNINVIIFVPKETHNVIYGAPYAITIDPSTGRVKITRWTSGAWATK